MNVVVANPPMFDEIDAVFNVRGRQVIFAWGRTIFNPANVVIAPQLFEHEAVHCERQGNDIEGWWRRYIADPEFRLYEEVPAHQAEYRSLLRLRGDNRANRRRFLPYVASRLAAPIYGRMVTVAQAKELIAA